MRKSLLGLLEACALIQSKKLTTQDYLTQCIALADAEEPVLKAFTMRGNLVDMLNKSSAGPLMGIPVAVKDIIDTQDFVTSNGSPIYQGCTPKVDAVIVKKIRSLGGVIFGKTVTTEFAWRNPGPTTNPWNSQHTPGGSSSGSAAAVAKGITPLALGSQTVGSIVRPAAFCGVVGFKASFGAVPRTGVHPVSSSLDHIGFFTRSVRDAVYAFNLLKNHEAQEEDAIVLSDVSIKPIQDYLAGRAPRIAVLKTPFDHLLSHEQIAALQSAVSLLKAAGAQVDELVLPQEYWDGIEALHVLMAYEAAKVHQKHLLDFPDLLGADIQALIAKGKAHSEREYQQAREMQKRLRTAIGEIFLSFDTILSAPATGEAPEGLAFTGNPIFCALWSFLGTPAIALPFTKSVKGLPLGIQLTGNYREDEKLLNVASFAELCFVMQS